MFANKEHEAAYDLMQSGQDSKSLDLFAEALLKSPEDPDVLTDRAIAKLHLKNIESALIDINKAVQMQPGYSFRYTVRAYIRQINNDLEGARSDYQKALELHMKDPIALNNLQIIDGKIKAEILNPEHQRHQNVETYRQLVTYFPDSEQFKNFMHHMKNGARNK